MTPRVCPIAVLVFTLLVPLQTSSAAETKTSATPYPLILGPIRLWEGDAPGALGQRPQDIPTLTRFPATGKATGATMLILPGGGYGNLAEHEGTGYAEWLAAH